MAGVKNFFFPIRIFSTPFHLVDRSPWPILAGLTALQLPLTLLIYVDSGQVKFF